MLPLSPSVWMTSQVHYRDDNRFSVANQVQDAVGKSMGNASPDAAADICPGLGTCLNPPQTRDYLAPELEAETKLLTIVIVDRVPHVPSCGGKQTG